MKYVITAAGLEPSGKGVTVAPTFDYLVFVLKNILVSNIYGEAGSTVLIERKDDDEPNVQVDT